MNDPGTTKNKAIQWLIVCVIIAGAIGVALVAAKVFGIVIPAFVITIFWIVACVVLAVGAIKIIASML